MKITRILALSLLLTSPTYAGDDNRGEERKQTKELRNIKRELRELEREMKWRDYKGQIERREDNWRNWRRSQEKKGAINE